MKPHQATKPLYSTGSVVRRFRVTGSYRTPLGWLYRGTYASCGENDSTLMWEDLLRDDPLGMVRYQAERAQRRKVAAEHHWRDELALQGSREV